MEKEVAVALFKSHQRVSEVFIAGPFDVRKPMSQHIAPGFYRLRRDGGKFELHNEKSKISAAIFISSNELQIDPASNVIGIGLSAKTLRHYRGKIKISASGAELECHNQVSMRDYVCSVIGSESNIQFPLESLKAQSVLVQTLMTRYKIGDNLNDSTDKQAYLGADYERPEVRAALASTWGDSLVFGQKVVPIFFHSTCAGRTSTSELFTGKRSDLSCDASVVCNNCSASPFWKPTIHIIPASVFTAKFPEGSPTIKSKDKAGRPMLIKYSPSGLDETGYAFWLKVGQRLGWDKMPGTRFDVRKNAAGDFELSSTGAGHGVGLCQWGAAGLAKKGLGYREILSYYFPGAKISGAAALVSSAKSSRYTP